MAAFHGVKMLRYRSSLVAIFALLFVSFSVGFPKEDLLGHLQDGFSGDDEECAG